MSKSGALRNLTLRRRKPGTRHSAVVLAPNSILRSRRSLTGLLTLPLFTKLSIEMFGELWFAAFPISSGIEFLGRM